MQLFGFEIKRKEEAKDQVRSFAEPTNDDGAISVATGKATYWSRSRNELWEKGLTSGNSQIIHSISIDCDGDSILLKVEQQGAACHTGNKSCFYRTIS